SLLVSQSLVPLLTRRIYREAPKPTRHRFVDALGRAYGAIISTTLRWPRLTIVMGLLITASASIPAGKLNFDFEPQEKTIALPIQLEFKTSAGFERVEAAIARLEDGLLPNKSELGIESLACSFRDWGGDCDVYPAVPVESELEMSDFQARITAALPEQPGILYRVNERDGWRGRDRDPRVVSFALRGEDMATR